MSTYLKAYMKQFKKIFQLPLDLQPKDYLPRLDLQGEVDIVTFDPADEKDGKIGDSLVIEHRHIPNTVVDGGEIWIAELLANELVGGGALPTALSDGLGYIHVGTSGTPPAFGDFSVSVGGISGNFYQTTVRDVKDPDYNELTVISTFTTGEGNGSLLEAGIFSTDTSPSSKTDSPARMFSRTTFALVTKTTFISMAFQWTIKIGTLGA